MAPVLTELTPETAATYAAWLASIFGTTPAGNPTLDDEAGEEHPVYRVPFADGTFADIWLESGRVYGEA